MSLRSSLLELTPEALMALANAGLVKRAQKDLAAGVIPTLTIESDGAIWAEFEDGTTTSISPSQSLKEASCTCPASNMCRHRVALVLAYQASQALQIGSRDIDPDVAAMDVNHWNPAQFDDAAIAATFSASTIEQARKLALTHPVATVLLGHSGSDSSAVPGVRLPMNHVRFFSRSNLAHARCDCRQGSACQHVVLAIWASRLAQRTQPGASEITLKVPPHGRWEEEAAVSGLMQTGETALLVADLHGWLYSLWREGSAQPLLALEARYEILLARLQQQGWTWVSEELEEVWQILQAQVRRSSRFDVLSLMHTLSQLWARLHAASEADCTAHPRMPTSQILGIGQKGAVALNHLRLISLGAEFWRDDTQEGACLVFADPDTQTVSVLERSWPLTASPIDSLFKRRVAGVPLKLMAAGQLVTKSAKRRANASLELGGSIRQTSAIPLTPDSWDNLSAPLKFAQLEVLRQYLRERPPASVLASQIGSSWHVIELSKSSLENWAWDATQQTLFANWQSAEQTLLRASLPHRHLTPGAVDALARALNGEWGALLSIAGPVWLTQGGIGIRPMSLLTEQRAIVLALEPAAPQKMVLRELLQPSNTNQILLRESQNLLGQLLRMGIRNTPPTQRSRLITQAEQLNDAGYPQIARLLSAVFAPNNAANELASLSMLCLLLQSLLV